MTGRTGKVKTVKPVKRLNKELSRPLLLIILALSFTLSSALPAAAGDTQLVYFEDTVVFPGEQQLEVPVRIRNNHLNPMLGLYLEVQFDDRQLIFERLEKSPNADSFTFLGNVRKEGEKPVLIIAGYSAQELPDDGDILTIIFGKKDGNLDKDIYLGITVCEVNDKETRHQSGRVIDAGKIVEGDCFIATAAFGSPLDPAVQLLRGFRDDILISSRAGRELVNLYYRISPPLAEQIASRPVFKLLVQLNLLPAIAAAYLTLHPWALTLVLLLGALCYPRVMKKPIM